MRVYANSAKAHSTTPARVRVCACARVTRVRVTRAKMGVRVRAPCVQVQHESLDGMLTFEIVVRDPHDSGDVCCLFGKRSPSTSQASPSNGSDRRFFDRRFSEESAYSSAWLTLSLVAHININFGDHVQTEIPMGGPPERKCL